MLLTMYVFLLNSSWNERINQACGISSCHLAPHHIINLKPYKNWNTFSLRRAVPPGSRIDPKTIKIVSLHCNTHLNAMVGLLWSLSRVEY